MFVSILVDNIGVQAAPEIMSEQIWFVELLMQAILAVSKRSSTL